MSTNIDINIKAKDDASKTIKEVAKTQDEMKKSTSELQKQQNELKKSTDALEKEQDDLESSSSSLGKQQDKLSDVNTDLKQSTRSTAESTADLTQKQDKLSDSHGSLAEKTKKTASSTKDLVFDMSAAATGAMALYGSFEKVNDAQDRVDKANLALSRSQEALQKIQEKHNKDVAELAVLEAGLPALESAVESSTNTLKTATENVNAAQTAYNNAVASYGENSEEAKTALAALSEAEATKQTATVTLTGKVDDLKEAFGKVGEKKQTLKDDLLDIQQAEHNLEIKTGEVEDAHNTLTTTIISSLTAAIPQIVTLVGGLKKTYDDLSGWLTNTKSASDALNASLNAGKGASAIGSAASLGGAATGVAVTAVGAYTTWEREAQRYKALTGKDMPLELQILHGITGMSLGGILASQTSPIPSPPTEEELVPRSYWNLPKGAKGAVLDKPTALIAGEGGETELLTPESKLRDIIHEGSGGVVNYNTFNITVGGDTSYRTRQQIEQAVNQAVVKASSSGAPATSKRIIPKRSSNVLARSNLR